MANCYTFTFNQLFSTFVPVKQISNHINLYQGTVAGTLVPAVPANVLPRPRRGF